jgi:fatty acid desaturase
MAGGALILRNPREWRTVLIAVAVYGGWLAVVLSYGSIPAWCSVAMLAWFGAWHLSLQHEVVHGHPSRFVWLNDLIASVPLTLWIPYFSFKREHLSHHSAPLTIPKLDSESFYVSSDDWHSAGPLRRAIYTANRTLIFRLLVWSIISTVTFIAVNVKEAILGQNNARKAVTLHLVGVVAVIYFVSSAGVPLWAYALGVVYGGRILNMLRPFAEHEWIDGTELRTAMVQAGPVMSLLMLNNNLHVAHHDEPGVAWYDVPDLARRTDAYGRAERSGLLYRGGYLEIARRFGVRPFSQPIHPTNY